ncbi:carboxylate-amine ligase [Sphingomonas bacterium]|uniref:carboxylate-amine ligase n=1 Tax=Sphingomonas bacterium TaxID=1895847 RepID=UPI001576E050|nr:carboxylate-amine ligase [Sphingomonas bacterium]
MTIAPTFRFGIEEELFLADARTRKTPRRVEPFHDAVHKRLPEVERELLVSQVEIMTPPCTGFEDARACLSGLRTALADIGREHGLLVLGGGSHPTARWQRQKRTKKERYDAIAEDMQMLARRDVVSGMHVHVEVPDPGRRVELMNRLLSYIPTFLALSASSPFWEGRNTGLNAYRLSVWGEMPRTGLPDLFTDPEDYDRLVAAMVRSGAIADASFLWWMLRPSTRFPTLELRVADSCTRLDDTIAIAALYRCLVRRLHRDADAGPKPTAVVRAIASENIWRAQRRGVNASFLDDKGEVASFADHLDVLLAMIEEDAEALGCAAEVARTREIVMEGTSADRQLATYAEARDGGATDAAALAAVVDWMATTTASP